MKNKNYLFTDDRIIQIGEPKYLIKRLLELLTELGRLGGYTTNEHKSMVLVYPNNIKDNAKDHLEAQENEYPKIS